MSNLNPPAPTKQFARFSLSRLSSSTASASGGGGNPLTYHASLAKWMQVSCPTFSEDEHGVKRREPPRDPDAYKQFLASTAEYMFCPMHQRLSPVNLPYHMCKRGIHIEGEKCGQCISVGDIARAPEYQDDDDEVLVDAHEDETVFHIRKCKVVYESFSDMKEELLDHGSVLEYDERRSNKQHTDDSTRRNNIMWFAFKAFEEYQKACFDASAKQRKLAGTDVKVHPDLIAELEYFIQVVATRHKGSTEALKTFCHNHKCVTHSLMLRDPLFYRKSCGLCLSNSRNQDERGKIREREENGYEQTRLQEQYGTTPKPPKSRQKQYYH